MFINKTADGLNNICGKNIAKLRKEMKISQRILADRLQLAGLDVDKNAIQRIEAGKRFVTDIELVALCKVLNKTLEELLSEKEKQERARIAEEKRQEEIRLKEQKERQAKYRQVGLCQHCGGEIKGLFVKKCVKCGKKKDY